MKAILTKYLGPTNFRGSRVKALDPDGKSVTVYWQSELNSEENHRRAADLLCKQLGRQHYELITGWLANAYVHLVKSTKTNENQREKN